MQPGADDTFLDRVHLKGGITERPEKVIDYDTATTSDTDAFGRYFRYMLENGIYIAPSQFEAMFISDALTDEDIDRTIAVIGDGSF